MAKGWPEHWFFFATQLSLICVLLFSLAGYLSKWHKYAELASHFKIQYLLASLVCLLSCLLYWEAGWATVAAFCAALNLTAVAPWHIYRNNSAGPQSDSKRLKLVLANVNYKNAAHGAFISFVLRCAPDVLIVQEVDSAWCDSLQALQSHYPFSEALPKGYGSGMAIYSYYPFEKLTVALSEGDARPGILAKVNVDGASVSLLSIHPRAPIRKGYFELRNEMLASAANCLRNLPEPKICIGDLNITPWSSYYRSFVKQTGMANVRKGFGLLPSWPAFLFFKWLMIPLDHCLISGGIRTTWVTLGTPNGSDHLPLILEIEIQSQTHS